MQKTQFSLNLWEAQELTQEELILIDGGGFWETFGIISGIAVVVAAIICTGGLLAILL